MINRKLILRKRPVAGVGDEHFEMVQEELPQLKQGEALVQVCWLGIDPTQRTWLNAGATYTDPVAIGNVMRGSGVGRVVESQSDDLRTGDWVYGETGWQDYVIAIGRSDLRGLHRVPEGVDPKAMLSVFGANGLTAYFGMTAVGEVSRGKKVFVSAAAGCVGSIAGQIAKINGAHVIGSAGGPDKCAWVTKTAHFDDCIDYRRENVCERLLQLCPGGLDIVFDNVGGSILESALDNLATGARIVLCGSISSGYLDGNYGHGPRNYMQLAFRRARMEGFIFLDYLHQFGEAFYHLKRWVDDGRLIYRENIQRGLEQAPRALQELFEGRNTGKQLVEVQAHD